jgi:hypothetical protein
MLPALFAAAVPMLTMSCDSNSFTEADFPLCSPNTLRVTGTIDGMSIDVTLPSAGGGLTQDNTGGDFQYQGNFTSDPSEADLRLSWDRLTSVGSIADATGTLRFVEGPFAGETFCAGDGTRIRMPGDDTIIQFELAGLRSGDGCMVARSGDLRGCMR